MIHSQKANQTFWRISALTQEPLITDGRNSNEMLIIQIIIMKYTLAFKINADIITKFKWQGFQIITINRKKNGGSGITPSYFPALMNMAIFGHFSQYRDKG